MSSDQEQQQLSQNHEEKEEEHVKPKLPSIQQPDFKVRVFWDEKMCDEFIEQGSWPEKGTVLLGFDAEYTPNHDVAMIQLSDPHMAVIIKLAQINPKNKTETKILPVPLSIRKILENPNYVKAGVAVLSDAHAILAQYNDLVVCGLLDISALAVGVGITKTPKSLGDLSMDILKIPKGKSCGGWAYHFKLTPEQAKYASYDAWTSLRVAQEMYETLKDDGEGVKEWCERSMKIAEPHVEEHFYNPKTKKSDIVYVQGHVSKNHLSLNSAPKKAREAAAEKRKNDREKGVVKNRLKDIKKKREKFKSDEKAIDDAVNALKSSLVSSSSSKSSDSVMPPSKKIKNECDYEDEMQLNFF